MTIATSMVEAQVGMLARVRRLARSVAAIAAAPDDRSRAQRDAVVAFAVRVASAGLIYLSQIVMARWMGGAGYGIYVFVWSGVLLLGGLAGLGLNLGMIRLVSEYRARGQDNLLRGLLCGGRMLALASGTATATLALLALWLFSGRIPDTYLVPACIVLAAVPLFTLTDVQDGIGRGHGWMGAALMPPYILRPLLLLGTMTAAHFAGLPMTGTMAAVAAVVSTWGAGLVQSLSMQRRLRALRRGGPRVYDFPRWLETSLPLLVIGAADILLQNADVFVISRYMDPADVGIYYAAAKTMSLILFVHYAVGSAVANRFAALGATGDRAALAAFVRDAVNWTFWPSLAAAVVILALGMPLLWLFGPQFTSGYPVMFVMVLGFLARSAMGPAEFLLNMVGGERACAMNLAGAAVVDIVLNLILVPRFGLLGAATATAASLVLAAALNRRAAVRCLGLDIAIWSNLARRKA